MKQKYIAPLAVIFLILLVLVAIKQYTKPRYDITQQVKLTPLVAEGLAKNDIAKLEMYSGGKPDDKLVIERDPADPNVWWITSHFRAPANQEKVESFIDKALALKGEPRDVNVGDASLAAYNLKDDTAFHVKGYKKDQSEPAIDVLVGKAPAMDQVFMRAAGSTDVYLLDTNLKREAGIFQDDTAVAPTADTWLKKEVVNIAKDTISKVVVTTPDKRIVIAKETTEVPADTAQAEGDTPAEPAASEESKPEADTAENKPATKTEVKWVLAEGGAGLEVKQSGVENLAAAFAPLTASDVVDPAKTADWGLESPQFTCAITVEGKEGDVIIEGGRPDPNGDGYVRVATANKEIIYKLSKYTFEKIFPKGTDLFTLKGLTLDKAQIAKIDIAQPGGAISLAKNGETWTILAPTADLEQQKSTLDAIANVLSAWTPSDYADSAEGAGLDAPTHTATITMTTGEQHALALGAPSKGIAGQYARVDGSPAVLVMSKGDIDRAFPPLKDLYQRQLLDVIEDDVNSVSIERAVDPIQIARTENGWTLTVAGATAEANNEACDDLAIAVADFEVSDIVFGQPDLGVEPIATVHCVMKDGTEHVFRFGPEENGTHAVALSGKQQIFRAEKLAVEEVLVSGELLKKPAPAPAEAAPDAGTGDVVPTPAPGAASEAAAPAPADATPSAEMPAEPPAQPAPDAAPAPDATPAPESGAPTDPAPPAEATAEPSESTPEISTPTPETPADSAQATQPAPADSATGAGTPAEAQPAPETNAAPAPEAPAAATN